MNQILLPSGKYIYDDVLRIKHYGSSGLYGAKGIEVIYKRYPSALLLYTSISALDRDYNWLKEQYGEDS